MGESIILTCYFNTRPDPQRRKAWKKDDFSRIEKIYSSAGKLGLDMIIFYDDLSGEFIKKYQTHNIRFSKYKPKYNLLNERFYCFKKWLENHEYENVFCLDADVEILKDPFELIGEHLIIGSEEGLIKDSTFIKDWFRRAFGKLYFKDKKILNCAILGGKYKTVYELLILYSLASWDKKNLNVDMAIFNKLVYTGFKFKTGFPIHTKFNHNEYSSYCYLRHK